MGEGKNYSDRKHVETAEDLEQRYGNPTSHQVYNRSALYRSRKGFWT